MNLLSWWTQRGRGVIASKTSSNRERKTRVRKRSSRMEIYIYLHMYTVLYISWLRFNTWLLSPILSNFVSFPSPFFRSRSFIPITIDRYPDLKYFYFLLLLFVLRNIVRHSNPKHHRRSRSFEVQIKFQFRISPDPGPLENGQRGGIIMVEISQWPAQNRIPPRATRLSPDLPPVIYIYWTLRSGVIVAGSTI